MVGTEFRISCGAVVFYGPPASDDSSSAENDRVLLIKNDDDKTKWFIPKGGIEGGESMQKAAMREVYEEAGVPCIVDTSAEPIGVQVRPGPIIFSRGGMPNPTPHTKIVIFFMGLRNTSKLDQVRPSEEGLIMRWAKIDEVKDVLSKRDFKIIDEALRIRSIQQQSVQ
ncbi:hypothetical protein H4219_002257 [Mycoemilia scoparia]|uniref:Nudix hydrolase domain-containing protein n=1 Tax=Mycoemilia scoparia TaxID=417184 RepID=A0A9W8A2Y8_9FUNG|nr:hypothetical protein H4219_002257 [Mycoemilia scoparia]